MKCLTVPDWEQAIGGDDRSYLSFWVPFDTVNGDRWDDGAFPLHDFLLVCCKRLRATHGYAGFASRIASRILPLGALRMDLAHGNDGLEIDNPVTVSLTDLEGWKGIKGVNWYTVLGNHYIEKLGGKAAIRGPFSTDMPASFRFYYFEGGLAIRAGDAPDSVEARKVRHRCTSRSTAWCGRFEPLRSAHSAWGRTLVSCASTND